MIGIIDYGMGNLRSVQKAFEQVDAEATILTDPEQIEDVDHLVLPGVGAFADAMTNLSDQGWVQPIKAYAREGRPLLGICLGLQLLFDGSEEDAPSPDKLVPGLSLLPGKIVRFPLNAINGDGKPLKVPHMGWNSLTWQGDDPLLQDIDQQASVYFVHSYFAQPEESPSDPVTSATTTHGKPFCATVWQGNIWATQFHPEKSQRVGLKMLANFAEL